MEMKIIFLIAFIIFAGVIIFYFSTGKRRRRPHYNKLHKKWREDFPTDMEVVKYSVFLIGDAGAPSLIQADHNLELLRSQLLKAGKRSAVFFLGDNIYPKGMPRTTDALHEVAEKRLLQQLKTLKDYEGKICFISGNHDWNKGREGGYESVRRQQFYVESYFGSRDVFLPRNGCPGPEEIQINDDLVIIVINTQWWVQGGYRPSGEKDGCIVENEHEFFLLLEEMMERNKDKKILVIGHHPMYSMAFHGGTFSIKQHLFPLTELNKRLYVPLPVAGSLYPIYRKYIGAREDMSHPKYKNMRRRLLDIFKKYDNLVYAAGHDHNLQYIKKRNQHYIVSGSGCKVTYVHKGKHSLFTHAHKGFVRLDYYFNDTVWIEVWEPQEDGGGKLAYRKQIIV
jgi:predicted MPP superfamily phosphohydrolase